jgi:hypothetical protein
MLLNRRLALTASADTRRLLDALVADLAIHGLTTFRN